MKPRIALFCACLLATPAFAAPGVMLKDDELKATASAAAASLGRVAKGASVEILARRGRPGHQRRENRLGTHPGREIQRAGRRCRRRARPRPGRHQQAGSGKVVAVAGLRGLDEEELRQARFNPDELLLLDRYASNRSNAERHARDAGLRGVSPICPTPRASSGKTGRVRGATASEGRSDRPVLAGLGRGAGHGDTPGGSGPGRPPQGPRVSPP